MDLFKYHASVKELELCKTVKQLEGFARKYCDILRRLPLYSPWSNVTSPTEEQVLLYKLFTLTLKLYTAKSKSKLPDFVYHSKLKCHTNLLHCILDITSSRNKSFYLTEFISYEQFMNWFEFDDLITLPDNMKYVEHLNTIIGDNPVHFDVEFNYVSSAFENHSTNLTNRSQQFIYAIRYKQVNFPNKPQTIWDLFLEKMRLQAHDITEAAVARECLKLEQQITAIKSFKDFYVNQ